MLKTSIATHTNIKIPIHIREAPVAHKNLLVKKHHSGFVKSSHETMMASSLIPQAIRKAINPINITLPRVLPVSTQQAAQAPIQMAMFTINKSFVMNFIS
jgi:hypothetical protein